ncbi:MAG: elongation factor Ts [Ignavibacteriales bacterium]|nr:elongation factor Ts [Ignavibacteriales bacterium]
MAITAQQVKELRDRTGAGMMDCKKALTESNGDFEKAIEILRKKGAAVAAKRAERSANEGMIITKISEDNKFGVIAELNCETDFVAKSDDFVSFGNAIIEIIYQNKPTNVDELLNLSINGVKLSDGLNDIVGKIGEKIEISRFKIFESANGSLMDYIHHGSKLGVMVKADNLPSEKQKDFAIILKDIAMQIAAMKPICVSREDVPKEVIEKEMEIYKEIALKEGKPANVVEKIAQGRMEKFYEEACLLEQPYVKDNAKTVTQLLDEFNKQNSINTKIDCFLRYHVSDEQKN